MADIYKLAKYYDNFAGLDLRSADISQNPQSATSMINADFRESGSLSKRQGYQLAATDTKGGFGSAVYQNVNSSGVASEEFITIDQNLFKLSEDSFTITYSPGDGTTGKYEMYYDTTNSNFYFDIYNNAGTRVLNHTIGNGYSGSNQTVTQLTTAIDALASIAATAASVAGGENAAFIPITAGQVTLEDGVAATITFKYYTQIDTPSTYSNPFSTFYGQRTSTEFENASFAQLNNILYISTGHNDLHKYDGLRVYKAGLPVPTTPVAGAEGAGSLDTTAAYSWKYTYIYKDAKGNEIEGTPSSTLSFTTTGASKSYSMSLTNLQETSGYNIDQAKVNGNQNGVSTITVDSGHGLTTGDYVYLQDGVTSSVVSRKVTATAATTITIDGAVVNVLDNAVISCLKLALYRTQGAGTLFYLSKELTNDTDNNTQSYDDGLADSSLGAEFVEPIKPHGAPVAGKYLRSWRNQLIVSGDLDSRNTVYYSDIENPEYFPPADNSFNVDSAVTGIRELDNFLFIFRSNAIHVVSGDFGTDQFEVDIFSNQGIGCQAFHTIVEVDKAVWFLHTEGVYGILGSELVEISKPIKPRFTRPGVTFSLKQAIAYNWSDKNKYMLYLPNLPLDPTYSSDTSSKIYIFNYYERHKAWYEWSNFNFLGGIQKFDNDLFFIRRAKPSSTVYEHTQRVSNTYTKADYMDHDTAISFTYKTHWETLGEPAMFKKFLRLKVYAIDDTLQDFEMDSFTLSVAVYGNFLNSELGSFDMDFSGGSEGYGSFGWGAAPWGEILLPDLKNRLLSKKLKSQQLEFTNSVAKENILISGYELEVVAPFKPAIKE